MQLQITFRNIETSVALETRIQELARKLERFSNQIIRCQVAFRAARRQLQDYERIRRQEVKAHSRPQLKTDREHAG